MGAPELWRIVVSLVGSGLVLGAVVMIARLLRIDLARLPKQWIPPAVTSFMMVTSVALLMTLVQRGPRSAAAVETDERPRTLATSPWKLRVYQLENWGELARRMGLGEEFSRNLIGEFKALGADVRRGAENDLPVGLYDNGRRPSRERIQHFTALTPFMCVSGRISRNKDGLFEATVDLHEIDRRVRSTKLWTKTFKFRGTDESSYQAALDAVGEIAGLARAEIEQAATGN